MEEQEEEGRLSPEQKALCEYWGEVLDRREEIEGSITRTEEEGRELIEQLEGKLRRREELGLPNASLCDTCRFIPGMCPQSEVNERVGKGEEGFPMHHCDYYDSGQQLPKPPDLPAEERPTIVRRVEPDRRGNSKHFRVNGGVWNPKKNDYRLKTVRGRREAKP